jgi:hypothetical protein
MMLLMIGTVGTPWHKINDKKIILKTNCTLISKPAIKWNYEGRKTKNLQ